MKERVLRYGFILIVLFWIVAIIVIVRKIPEKEKEFIRVGIAVYNMDDSYMSNYIEQLQVKLDSYDDFGKKFFMKFWMQKEI